MQSMSSLLPDIHSDKNLHLSCSRRHKPRYEFLALTPKPRAATGAASAGAAAGASSSSGFSSSDCGWRGDPESDIPLSLFPKHVLGLHASGDMAIHKVGEGFDPACRHELEDHLSGGCFSICAGFRIDPPSQSPSGLSSRSFSNCSQHWTKKWASSPKRRRSNHISRHFEWKRYLLRNK